MSDYRKQQKHLLWDIWKRSPVQREPVCQLCAAQGIYSPATDMHEVIPRAWTTSNQDARNVSYSIYLTIPLCHHCNMEKADTKENRQILLNVLRQKHGEIVDSLLQLLHQVIYMPLEEINHD